MESERRLTLDDIVEIGFKEYPISLENDGDDICEMFEIHEVRLSYIRGYLAGYGIKCNIKTIYGAIDRFYLNNNK